MVLPIPRIEQAPPAVSFYELTEIFKWLMKLTSQTTRQTAG